MASIIPIQSKSTNMLHDGTTGMIKRRYFVVNELAVRGGWWAPVGVGDARVLGVGSRLSKV